MFFKAAQKGQNEWYWYLLTILMTIIGGYSFIGPLPLGLAGYLKGMSLEEMSDVSKFTPYFPNLNLLFFLITFIFVPTALLFWGGIKFFHKRPFKSVLTGFSKFRWNHFWFAFLIVILFIAGTAVIGHLTDPELIQLKFEPSKFFVLVVLACILIPIQSGWEEAFFRGYLMQGLGLLAKNKWVPLLVTSLIFGAIHMANPEVKEHGWMAMLPVYSGMGLLFGIMVLMDNGLELAMGYHIANNIGLSVFITSPESALQTHALFRSTEVGDPLQAGLQVLIFGAILIAIFAWRFKWKDWGNRLWGQVEMIEETQENLV